MKFFKVSGERAAADKASAEEWIDSFYPAIIGAYESEHIYNENESALFFKTAPSKTLAVAGSKPTGGKEPKDCLFASNSIGTDKKMFVIGQYLEPRCFKRGRPPLPYYQNPTLYRQRGVSQVGSSSQIEEHQCYLHAAEHYVLDASYGSSNHQNHESLS